MVQIIIDVWQRFPSTWEDAEDKREASQQSGAAIANRTANLMNAGAIVTGNARFKNWIAGVAKVSCVDVTASDEHRAPSRSGTTAVPAQETLRGVGVEARVRKSRAFPVLVMITFICDRLPRAFLAKAITMLQQLPAGRWRMVAASGVWAVTIAPTPATGQLSRARQLLAKGQSIDPEEKRKWANGGGAPGCNGDAMGDMPLKRAKRDDWQSLLATSEHLDSEESSRDSIPASAMLARQAETISTPVVPELSEEDAPSGAPSPVSTHLEDSSWFDDCCLPDLCFDGDLSCDSPVLTSKPAKGAPFGDFELDVSVMWGLMQQMVLE
eukprot:jgi/Mesvir1/18182/Mv09469-RA.1